MPLECKSSALPLELIPLGKWFYSPIFSLFPRELQFAMNIIIKKQKLANPGIDPGDSRIQIERSTSWVNHPCVLILLTNHLLISSCVAIRNQYNYKETEIGESGYLSQEPLECKSSALPLELIPLVHWFYSPIFSLYPRELQLAMNIIIKKQELENSVSIPVTLEYKSNALPLELIPLCIVSIDQSFPYFLVSCN